jgi:hypothetical protein
VFFSGYSRRSVALISISAILFGVRLALRLIVSRKSIRSSSENVIGIANALVFIFINLGTVPRPDRGHLPDRPDGQRLLCWHSWGADVEVIHAATGASIGEIVLSRTDDDYAHFIYFPSFADDRGLRRHL